MDKKIWIRYLVILGAAVLLMLFVSRRNKGYEAVSTPILDFSTDLITGVEIKNHDSSLILTKNDSLWVFADGDTLVPAQHKISRLMTALSGERGSYITDKPSKYSLYNVDSTALQLDLYVDGTVRTSLRIGGSSTNFSSDYILYHGDPKVYMTQKKLLNTLGSTKSYWK